MYSDYMDYKHCVSSLESILTSCSTKHRDMIKELLRYKSKDEAVSISITTPLVKGQIDVITGTQYEFEEKIGSGSGGSVKKIIINGVTMSLKTFNNLSHGIYVASKYMQLAGDLNMTYSQDGLITNHAIKKSRRMKMSIGKMIQDGECSVTYETGIFSLSHRKKIYTDSEYHDNIVVRFANPVNCVISGKFYVEYSIGSSTIFRSMTKKDLQDVMIIVFLDKKDEGIAEQNITIYEFEPAKCVQLRNDDYYFLPRHIIMNSESIHIVNTFTPGHELIESEKINLRDVIDVVKLIHQVGWVHLDISRRNIIVNNGRARLIDFDLITKVGETSILPLPIDVSDEEVISRNPTTIHSDDKGLKILTNGQRLYHCVVL